MVSLPVHNGRAWRFEFLPSLSQDKDGTPYALQKLDLRWYVSHQQTLALGEVYTFEARLNNFHNLGLPGAFDYRAFQLGRGIQARGYVREAVAYHGIQRNPLQRLRAGLFQHLKRVPDLQHADLIAALMLGVKEGVKRESERLLRVFGLVHLLAISGLHVALVFGFVFVFLKALLRGLALARAPMPPSWLPLIVALAVVWIYALVSGWDIPVKRATLMLSFFVLMHFVARMPNALMSLMGALTLVIASDPAAVGSAGLWLSFGAAFALLIVSGDIFRHGREGVNGR